MKTKFQTEFIATNSAVSTVFKFTRPASPMTTVLDLQAEQKGPHVRGRIMSAALAMRLALGIALAVLVPSALAQTGYSVEGANRYVRTKDWNGLGQYATAWTKVEPNNPTAWYYLGNNYATGLQQPDAAIPAFQQVVRLDPNRHGA